MGDGRAKVEAPTTIADGSAAAEAAEVGAKPGTPLVGAGTLFVAGAIFVGGA